MSGRYQDGSAPPSPSQFYHEGQPQHSSGLGDMQSPPPSAYSTSSLPRYQNPTSGNNNGYSQSQVNSMYQPVPAGLSPLNPSMNNQQQAQAVRGDRYRTDSRYSSYSNTTPPANTNGGQHPLSNTAYYQSSPTLAGSTDDLAKKEKDALNSSANLKPLPYARSESGFKRFSGAFINGKRFSDEPSTGATTLAKRKRLGYLDGLKFIAAWVVLNGTLFDNAVPNDSYSAIQRNSPLYIARSTNLGICCLILLSARSILEPLWDVPTQTSAEETSTATPKAPSVAWFKTSRAMLIRPFRFILPVLVVAALQWGLAATGKTGNANKVGMDEPYWAQIRNFAGYATLVFDLFTVFDMDTLSGRTFGANLWVVPWLFQSSYCAYVCHIMLGNLSSNRYWVYFLLAMFSWFSFNFFTVAVIGVAICDMAAHGEFEKIKKWPFPIRVAIQLALLALALVTQWISPIRNNLNYGMSVVNVLDHPEIAFADVIFVTCLLLIVETSTILQFVFGNVVMRLLGKLSAGLFLLAPAITFTVVPDLALSMSRSGSSGGAILGVSWAVLFLACFGLAIVFHFLVELPSKLGGEYFADFCTNWGRSDSTSDAIKEATKKAKAAIKAPVTAPARLRKGGS